MIRLFLQVLFMAVLALSASSSYASLVERHLFSSGDKLITYDSATNLEWLDVTYTQAKTRQFVLANLGAGGLYSGFRYATRSEVQQLLSNAGITLTFGDPNNNYSGGSTTDTSPFSALLERIGVTSWGTRNGVPDYPRTHGFTDTYEIDGYFSPVIAIGYNMQDQQIGSISATRLYDNQWGSDVGHYLVRTAATGGAAITATVLNSSSNPSSTGSSVTFTATVTGGNYPTGLVTFYDGVAGLGSAAVASGGTAVLSTSVLSAGNHNITAVYGGDANNLPSTSGVLVQNVGGLGPHYSIIDLGNLNGLANFDVTVTGLTNSRVVAGTASRITFVEGVGNATFNRGFLYSGGVLTEIPIPTGTPSSYQTSMNVKGINESGVVVGDLYDGSGAPGQKVFTFSNQAGTVNLGNLGTGAPYVNPFAINNSGSIVGAYSGSDYLNQAFIYTSGQLTSWGPPTSSAQTIAYAVNNFGQGAGTYFPRTGDIANLGVTFMNQAYTLLDPTQTQRSFGLGINDSGTVIGVYYSSASAIGVGAFWQNGVMTQVMQPEWYFSRVLDINNSGAMVGNASPGDGTLFAFLRRSDGSIVNLNQLFSIGSRGWSQLEVTQINDNRDLAGKYTRQDGTKGAFLAQFAGDVVTGGMTVTATLLRSSANPLYQGGNVAFTATVLPSLTGTPTPTGNVTFYDGAVVLGSAVVTSGGTAVLASSAVASGGAAVLSIVLSTGNHSITAVYGGDANNAPSTSGVLVQNVSGVVSGGAAVTATALSSSPNPSSAGASVTFTATVTGGNNPTGLVTFYDGAAGLGSTAVVSGGSAVLSTSVLTAGNHNIAAVYGGDANNAPSTSGVLVQNVSGVASGGLAVTATALGVSPGTAVSYGTLVTLTGTVSGGTGPTGSMTFRDGGLSIGSSGVVSGSVSISTNTLAAGSHSLTASYGGDGSNAPSSSGAVVLNVSKLSPAISLAATPNPAVFGKVVTLTATVTGAVGPTGSVVFRDGAATLGSSVINAGVAVLGTTGLATGSRSITAIYSGDANHNPATSSPVIIAVNSLGSARVVAGGYGACALTNSGGALCWGRNDSGRLGAAGDTSNSTVPIPNAMFTSGVKSIATHVFHTCAVISDGTVWCSGGNANGQLGNGTTTNSTYPVQVSGLSGVASVSIGQNHSCALTNAGAVSCWGWNGQGQLGNATNTDSSTPVAVSGLTSGVVAIASGSFHTCAVTNTGEVKCWGRNFNGELGDGTTTSASTPVFVSGLSGIEALAAGEAHACALQNTGQVRCWGSGQLLNSQVTGFSSRVVALSAGSQHSCAVTNSNAIQCWGSNGVGQLGNGTTNYASTPVTPIGLGGNAIGVAAGDGISCALMSSGGVQCWGRNGDGQLGNGTTTNSLIPTPVLGPCGVGTLNLATSSAGACVQLNSSSNVVLAGSDLTFTAKIRGGIAPTGTATFYDGASVLGSVPIPAGTVATAGGTTVAAAIAVLNYATLPAGNHAITAIYSGDSNNQPLTSGALVQSVDGGSASKVFAGWNSSCALSSTGAVLCWGANQKGQIGNGNFTDSSRPALVQGLSTASVGVGGGGTHACVVTATGGVQCWGGNEGSSNGSGPLGIGVDGSAIGYSFAPVPVTGLSSGVAAITGGDYRHTCALTNAGAVYCWGDNEYGQLGNGTTTNSSIPVAVSGLSSGVVAIAAGRFHTCAVTSGGVVQCWGGWGVNPTIQSLVPSTIAGFTGSVVGIAISDTHGCAVTSTGGVQCWGGNSAGQLGDGTTTGGTTWLFPVVVSGLTSGVASVTVGSGFSCALTNTGAVKCWGQGFSGQLGNGTSTNSSIPVAVSGLSSGVTSVEAGVGHTCATTTTGVKCWGQNDRGQLGNGTTTNASAPVQVVAPTGACPLFVYSGCAGLSLISSSNPSSSGANVTFTATVTGGNNPTGSITFYDGAALLGSSSIVSGGSAVFNTASLSAGSHSITAVYGGDGNNAPITSGVLVQNVGGVASGGLAVTATALSSSSNPVSAGSSVMFTATVTGGNNPTGLVTFYDGVAGLGSAAVASGGAAVLSTSVLTAGNHSITAVYGGDVNNAPSTSGVLVQNVSGVASGGLAVTATALGVSPGTAVSYGTLVTLTGAVTGGANPTGSITFRDGGVSIGSSAIAGGSGAISTNTLSVGSHSLTASYGGDGSNAPSSSGAVVLNVSKLSPAISLVAIPNPAVFGKVVTFTATVGGISPSGSVTFRDGAATLGSSVINAGVAVLGTTGLATGSRSITAIYSGDANHNPATSSPLVVAVNVASSGAIVRSDLNGDGKSDVLWRNASTGENYGYLMNGFTVVAGAYLPNVPTIWNVMGTGDFDGDGKADILWRNTTTGENFMYFMNGLTVTTGGYLPTVPLAWAVMGTGDFNGDGKADILWRNTATGENYVYFMNGLTVTSGGYLPTVPTTWTVAGVGDLDGDNKTDILWRNTSTGENYVYLMNGLAIANQGYLPTVPLAWTVVGMGDFNGDGKADVVWRNTGTGENYVYLMNGLTVTTGGYLPTVPLAWAIVGTGDYSGDGMADILWRNAATGEDYLYVMNGLTLASGGYLPTVPAPWGVTKQ